jgi:hypothetical protein
VSQRQALLKQRPRGDRRPLPASERDLHRPIAGINDLDDILC